MRYQEVKGTLFIKIILVLFVIFSIINITAKQIELSKKEKLLEEKRAELAALQVSNEELQQLIDSGTQDELIERILRENGYVKSDERVYVDIPKG